MPSVVACPAIVFQFLNNQGAPAVNGTLLTQVGGVNYPTYSDSAGTVPLPNPIPLNSRGEVSTAAGATSQLFIVENTVYQFTLYDSAGNLLWSEPYINGVAAPITQVFATTAALLVAYPASSSLSDGTVVTTGGRNTEGDGGGGEFYYDLSDTTTADNGGTIRVDAQGRRWYAITDINGIQAALFGVFPNAGDVSGSLVNALNVINGTNDLVFQIGTYTIASNDIAAASTATTFRLRGSAPAYLNGKPASNSEELPDYFDTGGSSYTQTIPSWINTAYTVFLCNGTGFFGHPDGASTANFSYDNFNVRNVVFWAGSSHQITFHVQPIGCHISDCTFVLAQWFAICNRDFDQHSYKRCAFYDCGWNLAQSGTLQALYASNYVTGCAIVEGGVTTPQVYQAPVAGNAAGNGTQGLLEEIYIFNRTDFLANKSGYAGVYAIFCGDLTLKRVESITGCMVITGTVVFDDCHIESFASLGYSGSTDLTLWASVFYDANVTLIGGWGNNGFQCHNGPNAAGNPNVYGIILSQVYDLNQVPRPQVTALGGNPTFTGYPLRADLGYQGKSPTAGQGLTDTLTWLGVIQPAYGYHGLVCVTISLQSNISVVLTALFMINASFQTPSTYSFNAAQIGSNLGSLGASLDVTITLAGGVSTGFGQDVAVSIEYTGADWVTTIGIDVSVSMLGGTIPGSVA